MDLSTLTGLAGLVLAALAAHLAWAPQRRVRRENSVDRFRQVRKYVATHRAELADTVREFHAPGTDRPDFPLLVAPGWIPGRPLEPSEVRLSLREEEAAVGAGGRAGAGARPRGYWPDADSGARTTLSAAVEAYDKPSIWFDAPGYQLRRVIPAVEGQSTGGRVELECVLGTYFAAYDTSEALAYESGLRATKGEDPARGRYRRRLGDPFDLANRGAQVGVSTLTVRVEGERAFFFLHRRSPSVAAAPNITHVAPAGEFQPHADVLPVWRSDLDLWRNSMREYAEEFLGAPDASGGGGRVLNYERDAPYADMERLRRSGGVRFRYLGLGLDPLNWKPEVLTVCV